MASIRTSVTSVAILPQSGLTPDDHTGVNQMETKDSAKLAGSDAPVRGGRGVAIGEFEESRAGFF
jgi:hypothetical protein